MNTYVVPYIEYLILNGDLMDEKIEMSCCDTAAAEACSNYY